MAMYPLYVVSEEFIALADAAANGQIDRVQEYLEHHEKMDINSYFYCGHNLLSIAVSHKQYEEAAWLIEHGADVNMSFGKKGFSNYEPSALELASLMKDDKMINILLYLP